MTTPRLSEVECLRGLAISLVVVHHAVGLVNGNEPPTWVLPRPVEAVVLGGSTGVSLFFVLSGFLLSRPFLAEAWGGPRVRRLAYAARRILRIMPLYVLAVLVAVLVTSQRPEQMWRAVPYLLFLNAWSNAAAHIWPHSDPWWSLATEAQFYVLLPLLPLALCSPRGRRVGFAVLLGYAALFVALARWWMRPPSLAATLALAQSVVGRAPLFLTGIAAAVLYERCGPAVRRWVARRGTPARLAGDAILVLALASLLALLEWVMRDGYLVRESAWPTWHVLEGLLWAGVVLTLMLIPGFLKPLLVNRGWGFLGVISYSLYLVHLPLLWYGRRAVNRVHPGAFSWLPGGPPGWTRQAVVATAALILVAVVAAAFSYVAIERPVMRLKRYVAS